MPGSENYYYVIAATLSAMETIQAWPHMAVEEEPGAYINLIEELH